MSDDAKRAEERLEREAWRQVSTELVRLRSQLAAVTGERDEQRADEDFDPDEFYDNPQDIDGMAKLLCQIKRGEFADEAIDEQDTAREPARAVEESGEEDYGTHEAWSDFWAAADRWRNSMEDPDGKLLAAAVRNIVNSAAEARWAGTASEPERSTKDGGR